MQRVVCQIVAIALWEFNWLFFHDGFLVHVPCICLVIAKWKHLRCQFCDLSSTFHPTLFRDPCREKKGLKMDYQHSYLFILMPVHFHCYLLQICKVFLAFIDQLTDLELVVIKTKARFHGVLQKILRVFPYMKVSTFFHKVELSRVFLTVQVKWDRQVYPGGLISLSIHLSWVQSTHRRLVACVCLPSPW